MIVRVVVKGHYWDRVPEYQLMLDGKTYKQGTISVASGESESLDIDIPDADMPDGPHRLSIRFNNKSDDQTVKDQNDDPDNYVIVKDMTLEVVSIEIDTIDLGQLIWNARYRVDKPVSYKGQDNITEIEHCLNMGWNGSFDFDFNTPLYLWLLENL